MTIKTLAIVIIFVTNFRLCQSKRYDNYTLFSVKPSSTGHLSFLQNAIKQKYMELIYWKQPYTLHDDIQLIVHPRDLELFTERVKHFNLPVRVLMDDVQKAFDNQSVTRYLRLRPESFGWSYYYDLIDIYQWLADVASKYKDIVELESIGKSAEGRDIYAVIIKHKTSSSGKVIVEGGIHGNEWISTAFVTYLIDQLIQAKDSNVKNLYTIATRYHWYLIPLLNPDGYQYSHREDRLWRKNRRKFMGSGVGVDLNRNFGYSFGRFDTSKDPKDDFYCGPNAFSEAETKALADFINRNRDKLKFYFAFHGYGEKVVLPYSDKIQHLENYSEMENYARQAIIKMYNKNGIKYSVGTMYDTLGAKMSGDSASWVKQNYKVRYVFTFLLRDNGSYGFALPTEMIMPTCQETIEGLSELMTCRPRYVRTDFFNLAQKVQVIMELVIVLLCSILALN